MENQDVILIIQNGVIKKVSVIVEPEFSIADGMISICTESISGEEVQTVDARELHSFLGVGKVFANWIKGRIEKCRFVDGNDYVTTFAKIGKRKNVKLIEYHITLDMAKHLAMLENNDKGAEARQYFIECEKELRQQITLSQQDLLNNPETLRNMLLESTEKVIALEHKIVVDKPKVEFGRCDY